MRKSIKTLLWSASIIFLLIIAGCSSSSGNMPGMDMSKDNMKGMDMSNGKTGQSAESSKKQLKLFTTSVKTITQKTFTLTAERSNLEISPGKYMPVMTFNNSVPGPEIRVTVGDTVNITLKNKMDVPVTIHWHGIPVPNNMDGIPGVTQDAVQPGKSFTYTFKVTKPGTYWYHSHQNSVVQEDMGLYGAFIVEPKKDKVNKDFALVLDDWNSSGKSMDMSNMGGMSMGSSDSSKKDTSSNSSMSMSEDMSMYDLYTINGKSGSLIQPLEVKKGDKVRIRLINAGFLTHQIHLHGQSFKVIATDGQPINQPQAIKDELISVAPGERYDLEFTADNPGKWYLEEHGTKPGVKGMRTQIIYQGASNGNDQSNATAKLPVLDLSNYGKPEASEFSLDQKYSKTYTMNLNTEMQKGNLVYTINGKTFPNTDHLKVNKGDTVEVRLVNKSKTEDHPMHLHGHFFQVLSKNGKPLTGSPIWKDTINVKPGEEYVIAFKADNPGNWMFHCHDLHHAAAGMMTEVTYNNYHSNYTPNPNANNQPE